MITDTKHIFQFNPTELAYLSKKGSAPSAGKTFPLYIPRIMSLIEYGEPKQSVKKSNGTLCFRNAPECRVLVSSVMKTQNYLDIKFQRNKSWKGQGTPVTPEGDQYTVDKGIPVTCYCTTNSIKNMTFSND